VCDILYVKYFLDLQKENVASSGNATMHFIPTCVNIPSNTKLEQAVCRFLSPVEVLFYLSSFNECTVKVIRCQPVKREVEQFTVSDRVMAGYQIALPISSDNPVYHLLPYIHGVGKYGSYGSTMLEKISARTRTPFIELVHNSPVYAWLKKGENDGFKGASSLRVPLNPRSAKYG
jgi:hypothetical protein